MEDGEKRKKKKKKRNRRGSQLYKNKVKTYLKEKMVITKIKNKRLQALA